MNKALPIILVAVAVIGLGVLATAALLLPSHEPDEESARTTMNSREFLKRFDTNEDGLVSFDEFQEAYGDALVITKPDGSGDLTAEKAFAMWDDDGNGVVDQNELKLFDEGKLEVSSGRGSADEDEGESARGTLNVREFLERFDTNDNGIVNLDEFKKAYGDALVIPRPDGSGDLTAEEAFARWDHDDNGVVDRRDLSLFEEREWEEFTRRAESRGLHPKNVRGEFIALNDWQQKVWETEKGAASRGEFPWAGRYFDGKYFGQWAEVVLTDGKRIAGFLTEDRGRLWLLTGDAKLRALKPEDVTVHELGDDVPQMEYARAIRETPFDRPEKNLALARKAIDWGLEQVAEMLYARVLIFQPEHEAALESLGLHYDGRRHRQKEE